MSEYKKRFCFFITAIFSFYLFEFSLGYFVIEQAWHKSGNGLEQKNEDRRNSHELYTSRLELITYQTNLSKGNRAVWSSDRGKYFSNAELALKRYINYYPVDGFYWFKLLSLQYELYGYDRELNWTIARNLKLNSWNNNMMLNIAFYCVSNWNLMPDELQNSCVLKIDSLIADNAYKEKLTHISKNLEAWPLILKRMGD